MFRFPENTPQVLADTALQRRLETDGYVTLPLLEATDIEFLENFYREITGGPQSGFEPTTYFQDEKYREAASEAIRGTVLPRLEAHFRDYRAHMGSFIVKHPDNRSELGVHQDMTLVDESVYMGINIWIPLCDTSEANGALHLIPGSHRIFPTYRNANIPNIYDQYYDTVRDYMQPVYVKAGTAVIFDNSLLHFSPINRSGVPRIALNVFVTHRDARITICHNAGNGQIERFEEDDDFFTRFRQFDHSQNKLRPQIGRSLGLTDYDFPVLTPAILKARYGAPTRRGLSKLFSIFQKR